MKYRIILSILTVGALWSALASAVEVAPRITDREIIEALTELKAGQKALKDEMNQRFEAIDKRFESIDRRFESIDKRFVSVDSRFESLERRIDGLQHTMLMLFGALITLIVALFGYIAWDRRTIVKPLQERLDKIEHDLQRDLDIQHEEGSRLTRLVKVLREMAKTDEKLAEVLKHFSLL